MSVTPSHKINSTFSGQLSILDNKVIILDIYQNNHSKSQIADYQMSQSHLIKYNLSIEQRKEKTLEKHFPNYYRTDLDPENDFQSLYSPYSAFDRKNQQ